MPAKSRAQQMLMAMESSDPEKIKGKNKQVLKMSDKQRKDFAKTKLKGLPKHKNAFRAAMDGENKLIEKYKNYKRGEE